MGKRFSLSVGLLVGSLLFTVTRAAAELPSADEEAKATAARDEEMLRKAGLSTETKDLIAWLKARSEDDADLGRIDEFIKQLGDTDKEKREAAQHKLVMLGLNGWPQIIKAAKSSDATTQLAAKACMEEIENEHHAYLNLASIRLLVYGNAPGTVDALLRYLPFTAEERVEEEIYYGLESVGVAGGKIDRSLLAALKDPLAARRAVAGCIIGRLGDEAQKESARVLLHDKDAYVRLRSAQGILAANDKEAIPSLIDLLTTPSRSIAWQAGELLGYVAGKSQSTVGIGKELGEQAKKCQEAWAEWWSKADKDLDISSARRKGRRPKLVVFSSCGKDFADQGALWMAGCNSTASLLMDKLEYPWHVEWLKSDRLLVGDFDSIRLVDGTGAIDWETKVPIGKSRLMSRRVNPVCQQRYPFRIYYFLTQYAQVDVDQRKPEPPNEPSADVWEYGLENYKRALPDEDWSQRRNGPMAAMRLENGNWLMVDVRNALCVEVDGRNGKFGQSFKCGNTGRAPARITLCSAGADLLMLLYQREWEIRQINETGTKVWSWNCGSPTLNEPPKLLHRSRDRNILVQVGDNRVLELSREGRELWDMFSDHGRILWASPCLRLVSFGFPSPPENWDRSQLTVEQCVDELHSTSRNRRAYALSILMKPDTKAESAVPAVLDNLAQDGVPFYLAFLQRYATVVTPAIEKLLDSDQASQRRAAIRTLVAVTGDSDDTFAKVVGRLKDEDRGVRLEAATLLGEFPLHMKEGVPHLLGLANDRANDDEIRIAALGSIRGSEAKAAIPDVLELARKSKGDVHYAAARTLGEIRFASKEVVGQLGEWLSDPDLRLATIAATSIQRIGQDASEVLPQLLKACAIVERSGLDPATREFFLVEVLGAVGAMKDKGGVAVPKLVELARNRQLETSVRYSAINAIGDAGPAAKTHLDLLNKALTDLDNRDLEKRLSEVVERLRQ